MRTPARALLLLLGALLALAMLPSAARSELPRTVPNADASRTVTWTMNDSASLTTQNLAFSNGNASLPLTDSVLSWPNGTAIAAEGALDPNLTASPSGVTLATNWSNRIANGNFTSPTFWNFVNGTADNTTASWRSQTADARLNHTSGSTEIMWETFDAFPGNWGPAFYPTTGTNSVPFHVGPTGQYEGTGALGDFVNVSAGAVNYAGVVHVGLVDWSMFNRLSLWIYLNTTAPAAFNMSALNSTNVAHDTTPVGLVPGWQKVVVDLTQLGPDRVTLNSMTLRIVGMNAQRVSNVRVYFDAIRVGVAKVADTTARAYQTFTKGQNTTSLQGSAYLSFDWSITRATGVASYVASANLSGPSGFLNRSLVPSSFVGWSHFQADVSSHATATGTYNLSFALRVVLNGTAASNVTLFIDNASFVFPGTQNGTYLSDLQTMGVDSMYTSLSWVVSLPSSATSARLSLRTGNTSSPGDPMWSAWQTWSTSPASPTVPGALYFQLGADLATTNASVAPVLESLSLTTQHHVDRGTVLSAVFRADSTILSWRPFKAVFNATSGTSVTFLVGNGSYMSSVVSGSSLASLQGPFLQWQAILTSSDGLLTPSLHNVSVTYEFQGSPAFVVVTKSGVTVATGSVLNVTSGQNVQLGALVYDAGSHLLPPAVVPVAWSIDNATGGAVQQNGTYTAGKPGLYQISVVVIPSPLIYASVRVNVTASTTPFSTPPFSLWDAWPILAVGIAALAALSIYELLVRRLFAIDDVFLIAKDGRLIVHNTRRMRADRDEDILSGMLTAIMAFLRDQDPEENGELKRFEVGGKTTLLERGEHVYLTAIYSGRVPGWAGKDLHRFMMDLEDEFGDRFAEWTGSPEDLHGLKEFMQRFVSRVRYHSGSRLLGRET